VVVGTVRDGGDGGGERVLLAEPVPCSGGEMFRVCSAVEGVHRGEPQLL